MGSSKWGDADFGERLRRLRDRMGWTQAHLAEQLSNSGVHMTAAQVARIEKGERSVRAVEAAVLADLYGLSVDALMGKRARPKADLTDALRTVLELKSQIRRHLLVEERKLHAAAEGLAHADGTGRYTEVVAGCELACVALTAAADVVAVVGDTTNPETAAAIRNESLAMVRQILGEQEAGK